MCCLVQLISPCWLSPVALAVLPSSVHYHCPNPKQRKSTCRCAGITPMISLYFPYDSLTEYPYFILTLLGVQDTALLLSSFLSPVTSRFFECPWFTSFSPEFCKEYAGMSDCMSKLIHIILFSSMFKLAFYKSALRALTQNVTACDSWAGSSLQSFSMLSAVSFPFPKCITPMCYYICVTLKNDQRQCLSIYI